MINLIGEIAQYAVETDQIIRALAKERDDLRNTANAQQGEIQALHRRITDGKAENERLIGQLREYRAAAPVLEAVRKSDNVQVAQAKENK